MIGAQRRAERRGVARRDADDRGVEHVRDDLQDVAVRRRAAGRANGVRPRREPARMDPHRHRLRLDDRAHVAGGVGRIQVRGGARPACSTVGVISGTNHGVISAPPLPAGVARSAAENPSQSSPYVSRTRSRASDPLAKQISGM